MALNQHFLWIECSDVSDNCSINGWMMEGCTSNEYVQKYCQKSCGLCEGSVNGSKLFLLNT